MEILESQGFLPLLILALVAASLGLLVIALLTSLVGFRSMQRLRRYISSAPGDVPSVDRSDVLRERHFSSIRRLDTMLQSQSWAEGASQELAAARVPLRVGEYFALILFCGAAGAYLALTLLESPVAALAAGLVGGAAPKLYVSRQKSQRVKACEDQLVDLLSLSSNSLRSGWSFLQALEHVGNELPAPISEEIRQVLEEVSLGATPEEALLALQARIPSYDLELIVTAVLIQRRAGGNLAEMMDNIAHTIRERIKLLGEIRVITAEARMSMWLLALLPVGLLVILSSFNPGYMAPMLEDPRGRLMLMMAGAFELMGVYILRRMARIQV